MRTRRSPRGNQDRLYRAIGKDLSAASRNAALALLREARAELIAMHSAYQPSCREGCPTLHIVDRIDVFTGDKR